MDSQEVKIEEVKNEEVVKKDGNEQRRAALEVARQRKAEKQRKQEEEKKQREEELKALREQVSSLSSKSSKMEQKLMDHDVEMEVKQNDKPSVVTAEPRKRKAEDESEPRQSLFGEIFNKHNIVKTGALAALAGASVLVRNWQPKKATVAPAPFRFTPPPVPQPTSSSSSSSSSNPSACCRSSSSSPSSSSSSPSVPVAPTNNTGFSNHPYVRPVHLPSRNSFI